MYRLIVFDLDGTLVDSRRDIADSANVLLERSGADRLPEDAIGRMVGDGAAMLVARAFAAAGRPPPADALAQFLSIYRGRLLNHTKPYPHMGAVLGLLRVLLGQVVFESYGEHHLLIGLTVALSLVGVVTLGTLAGSMLPFLLRRLGFDPASASAPFVATLVDVSGLIIYFSVAALLLKDTLLGN